MKTENLIRNSNIELLRILLMFAICLWHTLVHGLNIKNIDTELTVSASLDDILLCSVLSPAVNCFMLIAGFYGMRFSINKILYFVFQAIIIYVGCSLFKLFVLNTNFSFYDYLRFFIPISGKTWWFLTEYIIIFLLSPVINKGVENIGKKHFLFILLYLFFFNSIGLYITQFSRGSNFLSMLFIYLLGRYFNMYEIVFSRSKSVLMYLIGLLSLLLFIVVSYHYGKYTWLLLSYNNPLIILQSIAIFYIFYSIVPFYNIFVNFISKHCFSVYLITELFGFCLYTYWAVLYDNNIFFLIINIIFIMFVCILVDCGQERLNNLISMKFIKKLNDLFS